MKTRKSAVIALLRQKGTSSSRIWRSARDLDLVAGAVIFGVSARLKNLPSSPSLTQAETSRRRPRSCMSLGTRAADHSHAYDCDSVPALPLFVGHGLALFMSGVRIALCARL